MKKVIIIILLIFIVTLSGCNNQNNKYSNEIFTIKEANKISKTLMKKDKNSEYGSKLANIKSYIGEYNNAYVLVITGPGGIPEGMYEEVDDYVFHIQLYDLLVVFYKNDLYSLKEAYELKIISKENLDDIYTKYTKSRITLMLIYTPYDEDKKQSLFEKKYTKIINIKEIPYIIASNDDGSVVDYWYYDEENGKDVWVDVRSNESLVTEYQKEILKKYLPEL